jgi:hypothetical protein
MLESALLQHMTTFIRKRNKKAKDKDLMEGIHERKRTQIEKALFTNMVYEYKQRMHLKFSVWFLLISRWIPEKCRSNRTNRILNLAKRSLSRIERSLDIKHIVQTHDDV